VSRINRVPVGLQDLLGSQNLGRNPADLDQVVRPGVDMFPFWGLERMTWFRTAAVTVSTTGQAATTTIPQGEAWIPLTATCLLNGCQSGDTFGMSIRATAVGDPSRDANNIANATSIFDTPAAFGPITLAVGANLRLGFAWPQRILYRSGAVFSMNVDTIVVAATNPEAIFNLVYYRLET
jgi:hypothetical protein